MPSDARPPWEKPEKKDDKDPTEGVRIIGAEEPAEAIARGEARGRRPEGIPRYGDRPEPPPDDVRPALRFPLSGGSDPGDVVRPRVSGTGGGTSSLPHWTDPPTGEVPRILPDPPPVDEDAPGDDLDAWSSF